MIWINRYEATRQEYGVWLDLTFDNLPPGLYQQGRLLRNDLAAHFSATGEFRDILTGPLDYPPQTLPLMLLYDLGFPEGEKRLQAGKILYAATLYTFAAIYTRDAILDESTFFDNGYLHLASHLTESAHSFFQQLFTVKSLFWDHYHRVWETYARAALIQWGRFPEIPMTIEPGETLYAVGLYAPYELIPVAAALLAHKDGQIADLLILFEHLHAAQRILQDLISLPGDLRKGKYTYPYLRTMGEIGSPLGIGYQPAGVLLALAFLDADMKIAQELEEYLHSCYSMAGQLKLETLRLYIQQLEERAAGVLKNFTALIKPGQRGEERVDRAGPRIEKWRPAADTLGKSIYMAEGYLLSDLTFEESWEVHRRGLAGEELVTARFPGTLILEVLCAADHDLSARVDAYFAYQQDHAHSYYDHPELPYCDSDNLAALISLYPYSAESDANREILAQPLEWMRDRQTETGRIPVWIQPSSQSGEEQAGPVRLIGERCGAIEARLLLALIDYDWQGYRNLIQDSATQLLRRFIEHGVSITVNYRRAFCLWKINQLLEKLASRPVDGELKNLIEGASRLTPELIESEVHYRITAQEAAFLTLASLNSIAYQTYKPRWVTIILKNQRSDGSWYGEPLFFVPNRGELTTWHASHLLTTAFCYHALRMYSGWEAKIKETVGSG